MASGAPESLEEVSTEVFRDLFQTVARLLRLFSRTNVCRVKNAMQLCFSSCKVSGEKRLEFVVKNSGRFRAPFPENRGTAKCHQKSHSIFHDDVHARFQEKTSRQHFCKPCRDVSIGADFWEGDATKHFSVKKRFSVKRGEAIHNSVNGGFGKDFHRKGNSVKRSRRFSEPLDSGK